MIKKDMMIKIQRELTKNKVFFFNRLFFFNPAISEGTAIIWWHRDFNKTSIFLTHGNVQKE